MATTSPGKVQVEVLNGNGVPGAAGHLTECAWADNDTFGVLASPTLSASALGAELRQMRPALEHPVK